MASMRLEYHWSWIIAVLIVALGLGAIALIGWHIAPTKSDWYINAMIIIACSSIGWAIGMILSPDSKVEQKKFNGIWKGVSLFASGYLVSKIDPLVEAATKTDAIKSFTEPLAFDNEENNSSALRQSF